MTAIFYFDGQWLDEQPKLLGPLDHAFWMSSVVFDGARAFGGLAPDIEPHCERLNRSARTMLLEPTMAPDEMAELCREAVRRLPKDSELYIRPMYYALEGFIDPISESTQFVLAVYDAPLPEWHGLKVCLSTSRRPARDQAPTTAKASCLYPNSAIALREAKSRGFDNAVVLDPNGNVAELLTANLWIVKDGVARTPAVNGLFLNGVTRRRIIGLLRDAGTEVEETVLTWQDVLDADEVFSTGNFAKVLPIVQVEERELQAGPVARKARELYFDYAKDFSVF
jgi:branched-chain amino acid aminotransferase